MREAHTSEIALVSVLRSQIAITPRGSYRDALEAHLEETRGHARRIQQRLGELEDSHSVVQAAVGLTETAIGLAVAVGKTPFDVLRGSGGEEKVLKDAKDACASEALEMATYTSIQRLASKLGDERTAKLAASIRGDEERMLERIMGELPKLTDAVIAAHVEGQSSYEIPKTSAADNARELADDVKQAADTTRRRVKRTARQGAQASRGRAGGGPDQGCGGL